MRKMRGETAIRIGMVLGAFALVVMLVGCGGQPQQKGKPGCAVVEEWCGEEEVVIYGGEEEIVMGGEYYSDALSEEYVTEDWYDGEIVGEVVSDGYVVEEYYES